MDGATVEQKICAAISLWTGWRCAPVTPLVLLLAAASTPSFAAPAIPCTGDCANDERVRIDDLVKGVNIAFGHASLEECRGANLPNPVLGNLPAPVTVQLVNSDTLACWEATYDAGDVIRNEPDQFQAKATTP